MIIFALVILGLALGSFVNALVWRIRAQDAYKNHDGSWKKLSKTEKAKRDKLSIVKGRSMCMHCDHELAPRDLVPVLSWLWLRGKCRYCRKSIDDTPLAELLLPVLFVLSYYAWPYASHGWQPVEIAAFIAWLAVLTCFVALAIYDARWYILPDRLVLPVTVIALVFVTLLAFSAGSYESIIKGIIGGLTISGIFLFLAFVSKGEWIGGGDVKLGVSLGLLAGSLLLACLVIFIASSLATIYMLPKLLKSKTNIKSRVPFGPFLISATFIVVLWGSDIISWYIQMLLA